MINKAGNAPVGLERREGGGLLLGLVEGEVLALIRESERAEGEDNLPTVGTWGVNDVSARGAGSTRGSGGEPTLTVRVESELSHCTLEQIGRAHV